MPRTPLLARVVDACRAARASHATGAPVDEVLDGALLHAPLSRRAFLGYAAAGAGLAACAGAERTMAPPALTRSAAGAGTRVAVVGAGLAGLTCAYRLRQQGISATVYEASTRVGGRCWTRRDAFAGGQIVERGGEFIDQSHTAVRQLAQELGLALDNVLAAEAPGTAPLYWFGGRPYTEADAARDLKPVWQPLHRDYVAAGYPTLYTASTARGRQLDLMSVRDWIDANVPGGVASPLGQLLDVAYVIEYGAETSDQSALNLIYLLGAIGQGQIRLFGPSNEKYRVRGGNDLIASGLAAGLAGSQIATGAALASVRRAGAGAGWTLGFEDGRAVAADHVVLALPFSILRERVDLSAAGFPAVKRTAIAELGMGANAKLALQFTARHWAALGNTGDTYSDRGYQATWDATRAQAGAAGILVDYTGGETARRQSGRAASALAPQFLAQIEPVLPGLSARWNGGAAFEDWPAYEWTRGAYSYWKVGQYARFAGAEGEAVDTCHFAGEHTSVDAQGYLDGAVESGARAAREVLAAAGVIPHA